MTVAATIIYLITNRMLRIPPRRIRMSECHFQRHLNKFTGTGAQKLVHKPNISASKSVESFLVTFPASVKHSIKLSPVMYRTRSPQKGKQEASSGAMEGSLDQALQAIREQLVSERVLSVMCKPKKITKFCLKLKCVCEA